MKFNGKHVIGNGEEVEMSETTSGDAGSAVVAAESVEVI